MNFFVRGLFGNTTFSENEEYLEFQFKFVCVLMAAGSLFALFLLILVWLGLISVGFYHASAIGIFVVLSVCLWMALRGRKQWFLPVACGFEVAVFGIATSAWLLVPQDELRSIWLYINVTAVYLILGKRAGLAITGLSLLVLLVGNSWQLRPYSFHTMVSAVVSMCYLSLLLYVQGGRALSYFSRMQNYNAQLHQLAMYDALTGVLNARGYENACAGHLAQVAHMNTSSCILFVDLDHFKAVNDNHGHRAGDDVLKSVADCLRQHVRATDVLGRIGGEEFCVFLPNTQERGGQVLAENLRQAIASLMPEITLADGQTQSIQITTSIGVASSINGHESMHTLQQRADAAMYVAKQQGRNRVSVISV